MYSFAKFHFTCNCFLAIEAKECNITFRNHSSAFQGDRPRVKISGNISLKVYISGGAENDFISEFVPDGYLVKDFFKSGTLINPVIEDIGFEGASVEFAIDPEAGYEINSEVSIKEA